MYLKLVKNNYSFRYRLPKDVQKYFHGRSEIIISLKTKDPKIAKVKSSKLKYEIVSIIEQIRLMEVLNISDIKSSVDDWIFEKLNQEYGARVNNKVSYATALDDKFIYSKAIEKYLKFFEYKTSSAEEYKAISSFFLHGFKVVMGAQTSLNISLEDTLIKIEDLAKLPKMNAVKIRCGETKEQLFLNGNKISNNTFSKYVKWSRAFYTWAYNNKHININIAGNIRRINKSKAKTQRGTLRDEEVKSLLKLAKDHSEDLYTMIKVLTYTGMRHSEFFKMKVKDNYFDLSDTSVQLKTASAYRQIPKHNELLNLDNKYISELQVKYNYRYLTKEGMKLIREFTNERTKVVYSLRHSFASKLQNALVNPYIISQFLGHVKDSSITTNRYAKGYDIHILQVEINKLKYI